MGLSSEDVDLPDVLAWAQEQSLFLRSVSARLVLLDLCIHAWRHKDNWEERLPGEVMRKHASLLAIQRSTGLGKRTIQRALEELQTNGYILSRLSQGNGESRIAVFWQEKADQIRADFRAGIKPLPEYFQKEEKKPKRGLEVVREGNIIQFPKWPN